MRIVRQRGLALAPVQVLFSLSFLCLLTLPAAALASHCFRANAGIWPADILYLSNRSSHGIYFKADEVLLDVRSTSAGRDAAGNIVRLRFVGANASPRVEGIEPTAAQYSYYLGAAADSWRRGVREYGGVAYRDLWPGIDLVFRDLGGRLGYLILVHGGDPAQARWTYEGASRVVEQGSGLTVETPTGSFTDRRAFVSLMGWLTFGNLDVTGATIPTADRPWSTFLGGGAAVDEVLVGEGPDGSVVVAGNAGASYAPLEDSDAADARTVGAKIFVARFSSARQLEWVCFLGGAGTDLVHSLTVGRYNVLIGGQTSSSDFPKTLDPLGGATAGSHAFLARLSVVDGTLIWSRMLGLGSVQSVVARSDGVHYAAGNTTDPSFPTSSGAYDRTLNAGFGGDGFVVSLDLDGNFLWGTLLGGTQAEQVAGVCLDSQSRPIVAGRTNSSDFPTTSGAHDRGLGGATDAFVACLAADGGSLAWSTYLGGAGDELASSLAVGPGGQILVGGGTESPDFPVLGSGARQHAAISALGEAARDGYVTALAADGRRLLWSTCLGGGQQDEVLGLGIDSQGRVVATGLTRSRDFWLGDAAASPAGEEDAFLVGFALDGGAQAASRLLGGAASEEGHSLVCLSGGGTLVAGLTTSQDFPTTLGSHDSCFEGRVEIFLSELLSPSATSPSPRTVLPPQTLLSALSNSPNPFNPTTTLRWELKEPSAVDLRVYDVAGRLVRTLLRDADLPAGSHSAAWDGRDDHGQRVASGVYLSRLRAGGQERVARMTLLK